MNPVTHFLFSWLGADSLRLDRRERLLATLAGVAPDADGLGIIADLLSRHGGAPSDWWGRWHHVLGHNIGAAACLSAGVFCLAQRRRAAAALTAAAVFHLHLLGDLLGSRGPDGDQWPIPYLLPFSEAWQWTWQGQWALDAWPNLLLTAGALAAALWLSWRQGRSPIECFSIRADKALAAALRARFGAPEAGRSPV